MHHARLHGTALVARFAGIAALLLMPMAVSGHAPDPVYPDGMISYWMLDEGGGSTAFDAADGQNGAITGATWTAGQVGGALHFAGAADRVKALNAVFPISTVEAWVKLDSYPTRYRYGMVAAATGPGGCTFTEILEVDRNKKASFYHWDGSIRRPVGTTILNLGEWYHLAATVQHGGLVTLYVNGHAEASVTTNASHQDAPEVVFGYWSACWGDPWEHDPYYGAVDEVAIYTRVLPPEEIWQHYVRGLEGLGYEDVAIDIKPGSDPNSINLGSEGVVPVAMLGSARFDPAIVDPATVRLAGAGVRMAGKSGKLLCHAEDVNGDGFGDVVCQVETAQLVIDPDATEAVLSARTLSGLMLRGRDFVNIVR